MVSGSLLELHSDGGFAAASCLQSDLTTTPTTDDRAVTAGDGFYCLVRAENACGSGTHGPGRYGAEAPEPTENPRVAYSDVASRTETEVPEWPI